MQPGTHGADWAAQRDRRIGIVDFFEVAEYHYFAIPARQSMYRAAERLQAFPVGEISKEIVIDGQLGNDAVVGFDFQGHVAPAALLVAENQFAGDPEKISG